MFKNFQKIKKGIMCDWCKNNDERHVITNNKANLWYIYLNELSGSAYLFHKIFNRDGADGIKINYCPNCGRKLVN